MSPAKTRRHQAIRALVQRHQVASQEELRALLAAEGFDVTQSTLSRDISELGLARVAGETGAVWALLETPSRAAALPGEPVLPTLLPQLFASVDGTGVLAVIRTLRGSAQPIAEALDTERWPDILGTIAGDDTILVICRSEPARLRIERRLRELARGSTTRATPRPLASSAPRARRAG
ncbi:MAG: arginine repressor [Gemmatimonadaceae bacterium]|jgi:transcriptional regulator of arginine metabolism|nr:arginine repressor [Gemmatimonadaceae bacterium]